MSYQAAASGGPGCPTWLDHSTHSKSSQIHYEDGTSLATWGTVGRHIDAELSGLCDSYYFGHRLVQGCSVRNPPQESCAKLTFHDMIGDWTPALDVFCSKSETTARERKIENRKYPLPHPTRHILVCIFQWNYLIKA